MEERMDVQRFCTYIAPFADSHPCGRQRGVEITNWLVEQWKSYEACRTKLSHLRRAAYLPLSRQRYGFSMEDRNPATLPSSAVDYLIASVWCRRSPSGRLSSGRYALGRKPHSTDLLSQSVTTWISFSSADFCYYCVKMLVNTFVFTPLFPCIKQKSSTWKVYDPKGRIFEMIFGDWGRSNTSVLQDRNAEKRTKRQLLGCFQLQCFGYWENLIWYSLRNENDLRIGMTYYLPFGMIDMTIIGPVSISRREIETEPGGEQKAPVRKAFRNPWKRKRE